MRRGLIVLLPLSALLVACGSGAPTNGAFAGGTAGAFGSASASAGGRSATPAPSRSAAPGRSSAPSAAASALAAIALSDDDLNAVGLDGSLAVITDGTNLDAATLDECGATYPSESLRTARLQTGANLSDTQGVSNEVVSYQSPADALQALTEVTAAAKACRPTDSHTEDDGTVAMYSYTTQDSDVATLPAKDNLVLAITTTTDDGTFYGYVTFQVSGSTLDGVYFSSTDALTATDQNTVAQLSAATGARLVAGGGSAT